MIEELRGVEEKWRLIGRLLGSRVYNITYPDSTDCLREVVRRKLNSPYVTTTWGHIIVALRKAGEPQLADNLKAKYIPGEVTTTTSNLKLKLITRSHTIHCVTSAFS